MDGSLSSGDGRTGRHSYAHGVTSPLLVEVLRGSVVESRHQVAAVVVDSAGAVVESYGDPDLSTPPRSAIKSLQALALVASGAADEYGFSDADLAMAVASHNGEPDHIERVEATLDRLGLSDDDLECGRSLPLFQAALSDFFARHGKARRLAHNCSGKHAGFLTLARYRKAPTARYLDPAHPVQQEILGVMASACEVPVRDVLVDGCGAPVLTMPLRNLAQGFATMVDPEAPHAAAAARVRGAIAAEPWFVAGTDRLDTRVCRELGTKGYVKGGAEGVYGGAVVDQGVGIAIKVLDGATRAAEVAVMGLLVRLGAIDPAGELADLVAPDVTNAAGRVVGRITVADLEK